MRIVAALFSSVFVLLALTAGCGVNPPTAIAAHRAGRGTVKVYDATLEDAWMAAHRALRWEHNGTPEDHLYDAPFEPFIVTYDPDWGPPPGDRDQVGVWFLPEGPTRTLVKVVVMSGIQTTAGVVGPDESSVQKDIAEALAQVQWEEGEPQKDPLTM